MPFTVEDFHDLVQLLEERPQWRAEMRRLVMSDEYLAVPEQIAELQRQTAELQRQTGELQRQTAELQRQTGELQRETAELGRRSEQVRLELAELRRDMERRFNDVDEKIDRLQGDVGQLKGDVAQLKGDVAQLKGDMGQLRGDVAQLKGNDLERRYRERAYSYFGRLILKGRIIEPQQLYEMLDEAIERGVLSSRARDQVGSADLVMRGRWIADGRQVMVLAEISALVDLNDVRRAVDRAALLAKTGTPVVPVVAGASVTERAADMARSHKVWQMLNGRIIAPPADAPANP